MQAGEVYLWQCGNGRIAVIGEECTILRLIPHGTLFNSTTGEIYDPQPAFSSNHGCYIGEWCEIANSDGEFFRVPQSWFQYAPLVCRDRRK